MTYRTRLVELQLKFGEDSQVIEAICLPKININLNLPGLSVIVQRFVDGYVLADKCLLDNLDKIGDIGLILGTNSSHCVMVNSVEFGTDSTCMNTPLGVLLEGNVNRMLNNLDNLPVCVGDKVNSLNSVVVSDIYGSKLPLENLGFPMTSCFWAASGFEERTESVFCVLDKDGKVNEGMLDKATNKC